MLSNSSSTLETQSWFIPFDVLMILSTALTVLANIIFILIIIIDRACHTVPMMLIVNTCLTILMFAGIRLTMNAFALHNDLQEIEYQYSSCTYIAYLEYIAYAVQNYSFVQQAFYRYMIVVYPLRFFWQSVKFHLCLIGLIWIFGFTYSLPHILTDEIQYDAPNQICQLSFRLSFVMLYSILIIYSIPMSAIVFIYVKLVRYVKEMSQHIAPVNALSRAQRELKLFQRTVILVSVVVSIGFPYAVFMVMSFFTTPPIYHFRISYIISDVSLPFLMIILFRFTEPLKTSVMKRIDGRTNIVLPAPT